MKLHYCHYSLLFLFLFFKTHTVKGESTIRGSNSDIDADTDEHEQKQEVEGAQDVTVDEDIVTRDGQTEKVDQLFTPAQSIEFFKSGIDSEQFEWINTDNVKAGETTCGFLYPPLGYEPDIDYPKIKVYICMRFATIQPAPKGNLFIHCGGPSTLSDCVNQYVLGTSQNLGQDNVDNYNFISIDQRGLGRSEPSFIHEECFHSVPSPDNGLTYTEDEIQEILDKKKEVVESCWSCEDCGFYFNATKKDNTVLSLNFLEFAGTDHLVEDIFMFMGSIGAPSLSLYGISYGTTVMATFATIFPRYVDKFVIDSSVLPSNQLDEYAITDAIGMDLRLNYIIYTCWAARLKSPDDCPVDDLPQCLQDLEVLVYQEYGEHIAWADSFVQFADETALWGPACAAAANGEISDIIRDRFLDSPQKRNVGFIDCNSYDQPTNSEGEGDCYGVPADQYFALVDGIVPAIVNGMDYAGSSASYNDKLFIKTIINFQETYESVSSGPASLLLYDLSMNYYWPKTIPLPVRGNPDIRGIVSGQQYDADTPYTWTSRMRENFPHTSLLTSQSIYHGLEGGYNGPCQQYIARYFEEGYVGFNDGLVCGDPYPYFNNLVR